MQVRRAIPEIDDCNLHILRHTFVCRRLDGVAMYTLSKLLGHSSIRVTEAHYANRVRAGRAEQAIKALEALRGTART